MGIIDDDVDDDMMGPGVERERAGVSVEREKPRSFGFPSDPLIEGGRRGGGNEPVGSGVWPGFGLEVGTLVEKRSWPDMGLFFVVGDVMAERRAGNWRSNGWRDSKKDIIMSPRVL